MSRDGVTLIFICHGRWTKKKGVFMKSLKLPLVILLVFISATISCQIAAPGRNNSDYYAGRKAGDACAKQDAMDIVCFRLLPWERIYPKGKLRELIAVLENEKSESFIRGFYWGYKTSYREYVDTYCGD